MRAANEHRRHSACDGLCPRHRCPAGDEFGATCRTIRSDPATRRWITANNPIDPESHFIVRFSPRSGHGDLDEFARIIRSADRDVLFATAFARSEPVLDALLGGANDDVVRFGIQNTKSRMTGFHADRTAEFTAVRFSTTGSKGG